ncbi:MAG: zinc ribbon domain-containing protein [Coriobacteriia bacterium]|nr:zinc ribbon domain-containing protein [Coriobacteriia bacterium]
MYCPKCGAQVADGSSFCAACGAPVTIAADVVEPVAPPTVEPIVEPAVEPVAAPEPVPPLPTYAPPPTSPTYAPPPPGTFAPPASTVPAPKKKRGCLIALVVLAALLLCCVGSAAAAYFGFVSLGKPRDLGVRYTEADYQSATTKLGIDVSQSGPESPTATDVGTSGTTDGTTGGTTDGTTDGTTGGATGGTTGGTTGTTTKPTITTKRASKPVTEGPAKGTKVVYEGSKPIDITLTSAEFSALMSMHHYSPNWLVQDFQVKFGENGQLEMSGYVVWDGRMYGGYAQADAALTGPQSVGGAITTLEAIGVEIPAEYNGPAGDYIAGVMNDWLAQMEGLNLQSATIEGGQLHLVGSVPAKVIRVPAGQ